MSFSIGSPKHLFCLSYHLHYLLTNLSITEKSETFSAKSLAFDVIPSERLFVYNKNKNGTKIDPCSTPTSVLDHEGSWPFNTTLRFLSSENLATHPAAKRCSNFLTTSFYTPQPCRGYMSNITTNSVSMERRQDVSQVRLHDVLLERCSDVSRGRNNYIPSVCLNSASKKSQMKHLTISQWYIIKISQWYVFTTSYVSKTSPLSPKWNVQ